MLVSTPELTAKITLGERAWLECTEVRFSGSGVTTPRTDAFADGVAAFANSRGGVFVLGVEDDTRDVVGIPVERLDAVVDFVKEVCASSIDPPLEDWALLRLFLPTADGQEVAVIKVEVPRSLFVHRSPRRFSTPGRRFQARDVPRVSGSHVPAAQPDAPYPLRRAGCGRSHP